MSNKHNYLDFSGQDIYIGIDSHRKQWTIKIMTEEVEHKSFTISPPNAEALRDYLHKYFPNGKYLCAYEAGFSGFWAQRKLESIGINCIVVNAADVPSRDKDKRQKTDRIDSRKIAKGLRDGQLDGIYVPSKEAQDDRSLLRTRTMLVRNQTRCKNRIKSMLYYNGIELNEPNVQSYWSKNYIRKLESIDSLNESAKVALDLLIVELKSLKELIVKITLQVRKLSQNERYNRQAELLKTIPGIGLISAMVILTEIIDVKRFGKYDKINSFVGLMPMENSSGDRIYKGRITPRCNKMLRYTLIESAWTAISIDPALLQAYKRYLNRGIKSNKAIIKIARKLFSRIIHVLIKQEAYSIGIVQ